MQGASLAAGPAFRSLLLVTAALLLPLQCQALTHLSMGGSDDAAADEDGLWLGVAYYPEQWPESEMELDLKEIKQGLGANIIRIGEFMWSMLEPREGDFNFTFLDKVIDSAESVGLKIMLGTPTATMPAWLYHTYPEVRMRVPDSPDGYLGAHAGFGGRRQYSFNSDTYRKFSARIVSKLAERYGKRESIVVWQVDNELGHEGSDVDVSEASARAWRTWVQNKYHGDIQAVNEAWGTVFWSTTYGHFNEIPVPGYTIPGADKRPNEAWRSNLSPGMLLDFRRFRRDSITDFANMQVDILKSHKVLGAITTNAPGGPWGKAIDHNHIFARMDFAAYDNYPVWGGSTSAPLPSTVALALDRVRGWGPANGSTHGGFMVAEQLIGAQGHDIIGYTPRPGQAKAWTAAAFTHGALHVLFFRYRAAVFGQEQFCFGVLDHTTERGTGRKWAEAKETFALARAHASLWSPASAAASPASVALLYSTDSVFAWQAQPQSTAFDPEVEAHRLYSPFWRNGVRVDVLAAERLLPSSAAALLARYRVLLLPALMIVPDGLVALLKGFVGLGGSLWVGFRSDVKDAGGRVRREASALATLSGVRVEEIEALNLGSFASVERANATAGAGAGGECSSSCARATVWREGLSVLEPDRDATEVLFRYSDRFFGGLGLAAVTRKRFAPGGGSATYVGAGVDPLALEPLASETLDEQGVERLGVPASAWLEQAVRTDAGTGKRYLVAINHGDEPAECADGATLEPYSVRIAERGEAPRS
mmetsp:Transcript_20629/g.50638  ORF Transcript_20629/g.50638 Transcript_20629/m.50638 type:complete len:763 (+) Transcript_20629:99-2387(+)